MFPSLHSHASLVLESKFNFPEAKILLGFKKNLLMPLYYYRPTLLSHKKGKQHCGENINTSVSPFQGLS